MNISVKHQNALDIIHKWCVDQNVNEFAAGHIQSPLVNRAMQGLHVRGFVYKTGKEIYITTAGYKRVRHLWALTPQGIKSNSL